jgi:murein L,D-transpeptidase YcbB/YkuD
MTARMMFGTVGAAFGGLLGWFSPGDTEADPRAVRRLLVDLGVRVHDESADLGPAVRRFQREAGLLDDGVAGPRTVHLLARYAAEARDLDHLHLV